MSCIVMPFAHLMVVQVLKSHNWSTNIGELISVCASSKRQPNAFQLSGGNFKSITYSSTSISGKPLLDYVDAAGRRHGFMGDEIRRFDSEIGWQVTVTTDRLGTTLTLLIPIFNLGEPPTFFTTWAITTTRRHLRGQDVVVETYRMDELTGKAEFHIP